MTFGGGSIGFEAGGVGDATTRLGDSMSRPQTSPAANRTTPVATREGRDERDICRGALAGEARRTRQGCTGVFFGRHYKKRRTIPSPRGAFYKGNLLTWTHANGHSLCRGRAVPLRRNLFIVLLLGEQNRLLPSRIAHVSEK